MPSQALAAFSEAVKEVQALQKANVSPSASSPFSQPEIKRAIGRSQVVLLSSHYERYLYAVNEEASDFLVAQGVAVERLPLALRLLHSKGPVEKLVETQWDNRETSLRDFSAREMPIWIDGTPITTLEHGRFLEWMKAPSCESTRRYYRQWGIPDIFSAVTRTPASRTDFWLRIESLVEKRNNIAHGDLTVEATYLDVVRYLKTLRSFVPRIDRRLSKVIGKIADQPPPW